MTDKPNLDWDRAKELLDQKVSEERASWEAIDSLGVSWLDPDVGSPWGPDPEPLLKRYERGERTEELYREIMELE